ncbi:hypothetical protein [Peribacillus glennii]|uniref:Uncharacterized protein n=1 Tax=Peribacillus glennii TaxID=2303991 RepID=A0A372L8Y1_9BACI|nr:hypothetical protein [Peribacillus glennii]RFU61441.1 hypothetical protein D0466_18335 [Peribacillus glennii]
MNNNFRLNFNGLNGNLAFQLFRFKGCKVKVVFECGGGTDEVTGRICNVGTNFVDIIMENHKVVTIMINRICKLDWLDKHCNPCPVCFNPCDADHVCPHCGEDPNEEDPDEDDDEGEQLEDH